MRKETSAARNKKRETLILTQAKKKTLSLRYGQQPSFFILSFYFQDISKLNNSDIGQKHLVNKPRKLEINVKDVLSNT